MNSLPTAILFDLDETIITFGNREQLLTEVAEQYRDRLGGIPPTRIGAEIEAEMKWFWSRGEDVHRHWRFRLLEARVLIVQGAFRRLRSEAPELTDEFGEQFANRFHEIREDQSKLFPQAFETLQYLRDKGVRMALITNGLSHTQRSKIEKFNLAGLFDHIQIEEEAGVGKPFEEAYIHAMDALGVSANETWMVGDNLEWEVAAPQRLGIFSIWHDTFRAGLPPGSEIKPDRIVRTIAELIE